jgi:hypothetical protein
MKRAVERKHGRSLYGLAKENACCLGKHARLRPSHRIGRGGASRADLRRPARRCRTLNERHAIAHQQDLRSVRRERLLKPRLIGPVMCCAIQSRRNQRNVGSGF